MRGSLVRRRCSSRKGEQERRLRVKERWWVGG